MKDGNKYTNKEFNKTPFSYHLNILVSSSPDPPLSAPVHPTVSPDHSSQHGYLLLGYTGLTEPTKYDDRRSNYKLYIVPFLK